MALIGLLGTISPAGAEDTEPKPAGTEQEESASSADSGPLDAADLADDAQVPSMSRDIDEMIVRAGSHDDLLRQLPVSVTTFSSAQVKSLRIQNIADLAAYTPNLEINTAFAASNPTLFIRGIGLKDYNANAAGAVAVYQDGININSPAIQLGQLFDVEEIAILRGPQGSSNGRNATAGAIMVNSVLPDGEVDVSASFSYGNFNYLEAEGALSFPLIDDLLSVRAAFVASFRDGTTTNHCSNWDPESIGKPRLTEESIREAWVFNGSPTNKARFPKRSEFRREKDSQGRELIWDAACIWNDAGHLSFDLSVDEPFREAIWVDQPIQSVRTLADFQGLKRKVNNWNNWGSRIIFRLQPDVDDGMDWVLNVHGGQNLSDSRRLQSLGSDFVLGVPAFREYRGQPSEALAAVNSGLEGIREVDGLYAANSQDNNLLPGGRGGSDVDAGFYDRDGLELLDTWGVNLRGEWNTGSILLTSHTGYEWYDRTVEDEGDATPIILYPGVYKDSAFQLSQELRMEKEAERYRFVVGGFFLYENLDSQNIFPGIRSRRIEQQFDQKLVNFAPYANGRYWLLDEVYVDGGIRFNWERKEFTLSSLVNALDGGQQDTIPEETTAEIWTGLSGNAVLAWQPESDWMYDARLDFLNLYLSYGRGMKGGHFNAGLTIQQPAGVIQRLEPVEPEFIHSVEMGFKSTWLQNRIVLNVALFRYWYKDLQIFDFENERGALPLQKLLNSDARVLGAELELQTRPLPGLLIQFGGGWLESEFKNFFVSKAVARARGRGPLNEFDYSGNPLISAPKWNFSGLAEYQISFFGLGFLVPQYDFSYRSKVYLDPQALDPISQDGYWNHNARLAFRTPDGSIEVAGWVENILEKRYKIDVFDLSLDQNSILEVWNDPRAYGLTVSLYY